MLLLVSLFLQYVIAYITFDSGDYVSFDYVTDSNFVCQVTNANSYSFANTIPFSDTFANVPQIIFFPYYLDQGNGLTTEFTFTPSSITTTDFTVTIECTTLQRLYVLRFNWVAVYDNRIEVINFFNFDLTGLASKTFTVAHSNIFALQGFVTFLSLGFGGVFDFQLTIQSITANQAVVSYTASNTNIFQLGFQLVLGTYEVFEVSSIITRTQLSLTTIYDSGVMTLFSGFKLFIALESMTFLQTDNIRIKQTLTYTPTTIQYQKWGWSLETVIDSLSWQEIYFNTENSLILVPMQLKKMRISKGIYLNQNLFPIKLELLELSQTYTAASSQQIPINSNIQTLNIVTTFQCSSGKKVQGSILKCLHCSSPEQSLMQNCYGGMNQITHHITLYQPNSVYQIIQLDVTSSGFTISQSVLNQVGLCSYTLLSLNIMNQ